MLGQSTATALALLSLLSLSTAQQLTTNCSTFNWNMKIPSLDTYAPKRVSEGKICDAGQTTETCLLTALGDEQYSATTNITSLNTTALLDLVIDAIDKITLTATAPWLNDSVIGSVDSTMLLEPDQAAYINFTAYKFCFNGTVADCDEGIDDDSGVSVCAPIWHWSGDDAVLEGEYSLVNFSREDVNQYQDPYEKQQGDEPGEGGATDLEAGLNSGLLAVLVSMVAVLVV
ncbi:uncharacterized protein BDV14DRAFT_204181 [Aspergillus stella-maris]|uniref:uncharacterized protein n=1 Tax=Aspergillus stella-maris TaxID=1810926 RepID=UPI003CCD8E1C